MSKKIETLPCTDDKIASYNVYDKNTNEIRVSALDESLIDSVKERFPKNTKTGPFGAQVDGSKVRDFQQVLAAQRKAIHDNGGNSQVSYKYSASKIFAAIFVIGCVVGIAVFAIFKYIN